MLHDHDDTTARQRRSQKARGFRPLPPDVVRKLNLAKKGEPSARCDVCKRNYKLPFIRFVDEALNSGIYCAHHKP